MADKNEIESKIGDESGVDDKIVEQARKRYKLNQDSWSDIRKVGLSDLNFTAGDHWPEDMKRERERDKRPMLVINRMPQIIKQVTNDQRQNRSAIKVSPVDRGADVPTAKVFQGLIRHIEYNSNAEDAQDCAFEGAVRKGFGFFRVTTDYADPMSFSQEIFIKKIRNHFSVSIDPHSKESDGSDMNWAIVEENIPKDEFETLYPDHDLNKNDSWNSCMADSDGWIEQDSIKIAEYFTREFKKTDIILLSNGDVLEKDKLAAYMEKIVKINAVRKVPTPTIGDTRSTMLPVIKWYKIAGTKIVERTDWAGKWIPIIPVYGDELDIEGKLTLESLIRHSKDANLMYDVWASAEAETIALMPKTPFIGTPEQVKGFERQWATANSKNHAFLPYNAHSTNGQMVPPPQRNSVEPAVSAITQARMLSADDIKTTSGIFDAGTGAQSNEISGVAIMGRQRQIQTSNFHFVDNLNRSRRHLGRILVDLIPKIYDQEQVVRILGEDGKPQTVTINGAFTDEKGVEQIYDLSVGRYDVNVSSGPSYATKRQEARETMLSIAQSFPQIMQIAGDLFVNNFDWDQVDEISARLRRFIDPKVLGDEETPQIPPELQMQMQQFQQQIEMLSSELMAERQKTTMKVLEIQSKERIEAAKIEADLIKKAAELDAKAAGQLFASNMAQMQAWQDEATATENKILATQFQNSNGMQTQQSFAPEQNTNPTGGQTPGNFME